MNAFELYLLAPGGEPASQERILQAIRAEPWIRRLRADANQLVFNDEDTGVVFQLVVAATAADGEESSPESLPAPEEGSESVEEPPIEMAPVTITLVPPCPSFFGREALAAAERIAAAASLEVRTGAEAATPADILAEWDRANREAAAAFKGPEKLARWSAEASSTWWEYGSRRAAIEAELAAEGVQAPRLHAARLGGDVRSLFVWDVGTPTVIPWSDLVLVRRQKQRKGLLFTRTVTEEGLASGERIRDLLAAFGEVRSAPYRAIIFREAKKPPQQVAAELETIALEPVDSVKRTQLFGVIDFDPAPGETRP